MTKSDISDATKRILPWIIATGMLMENLDATIINTAVPTISADLNVLPLDLRAVLTSYTLALAVFIPISGWLADRFGTKRIFTLAILLFILGSLLSGLSFNIPTLVIARLIQGAGGAMMTPVGRLVLVRTYPRSDMVRVMNYVVIPALVGPLIGPFLGGLIVYTLHWRIIFFINIPIGLLGLYYAKKYMVDYRAPKATPLDHIGFFLFGTGVALLSYVLEIIAEHRLSFSSSLLFLAISLISLALYVWHAKHVKNPVLQLRLFAVRTFRVSVIGGFITRLAVSGMPFLLPLLYQIGLGYKPWQAGLLTMPSAFAAIGLKIISTKLLARFGHRHVLLSNTVLLGINISLFSFIGPHTPVPLILVLSFLQGLFSSLQFTAMNTLTYADISDPRASRAASIASTAQQLALSFGVATSALVAGIFLHNIPQTDTPAYISGLHHAFLALGIFTILTSISFRALKPTDALNVSHYKPKPIALAATEQDP